MPTGRNRGPNVISDGYVDVERLVLHRLALIGVIYHRACRVLHPAAH